MILLIKVILAVTSNKHTRCLIRTLIKKIFLYSYVYMNICVSFFSERLPSVIRNSSKCFFVFLRWKCLDRISSLYFTDICKIIPNSHRYK